MSAPSVSVVVRAFNAERFVGQTLDSILAQTEPADEVIVVDDGSADGTRRVLDAYADRIRVVRQANGGLVAALNRGYAEARSDYVANCDSDDIWEPGKLARQREALRAHPEVDIAFAGAWNFGLRSGPWSEVPGSGALEPVRFGRAMYDSNLICASSAVVRRGLYARLGPFTNEYACEDYDFWLRALQAGARFYYDPRILVRYRRHGASATAQSLRMHHGTHLVHRRYADVAADPRLVARVLARDHFRIARSLVERGQVREARNEFVSALRRRPSPRAVAWTLALSAPERWRPMATRSLVALKRCVSPTLRAAAS